MSQLRILHIWALLLLSHPLLSSEIKASSHQHVNFNHQIPTTLDQALQKAYNRFNYFTQEDNLNIVDEYLNGPRTLGNERLSMLFIKAVGHGKWEVMLTATHFLGDGMALHTFMNDFYTILGSDKTTVVLKDDIISRLGKKVDMPGSLENRLQHTGAMARIVGNEEYIRSEGKNIGGQSFPSSRIKRERKTVVSTFAYGEDETTRILGKCKANGVTIAHAVFALCNIAWARRTSQREDPWYVPILPF
jgi:hypothetical protein